uniref:Uncharacterized protein n=1 Tax=Arundo donax TaxID=35708 RepID=A0A0A9BPN5_ARUDO
MARAFAPRAASESSSPSSASISSACISFVPYISSDLFFSFRGKFLLFLLFIGLNFGLTFVMEYKV